MSFGFGGNNNNNTNTFGGFGSSNTGTGFGANNASTGGGGGSLFGNNTAASGGGFGGFGASNNNNNNSSPFGGAVAKPTFGAAPTAASGSLFGGNTNNTATTGGFGGGSGGGGFGSSFGNNNTGGGLFGQQQNRPATTGFGATNTAGSLFGGGNNTTGGFGTTNNVTSNPFSTTANNTGFGASNAGGGAFTFGGGAASTATNNNNGTANPPFSAVTEKESSVGANTNQVSAYQSITFQAPYLNKSFEELRTEDYAQGRRYGNTNGQAGGFGQSTGFGGLNTNNANTGGGMFGNNTATATTGNTGFGASNTNTNNNAFGGFGNSNTSGGLFGAKTGTGGGLFGGQQATNTNTAGFGNTATSGGGLFGGGNNAFGNNTNTNTGGGLFGNNTQQQPAKPTTFGGFGASNTNTGFGATNNTGGGLFGNTTNTNTGGGLFGQQNNQQQQQQNNPFGATNTNTGGGLFGNQNKPASGSLFGNNTTTNTGGGLFGAQNNQQQNNPFGQSTNTGGGLFGAQNQNKPAGTSLFGNTNTNNGGGLFGAQNNQNTGTSLFGGGNTNTGASLFGNQNKPAGTSLFGNTTNTANNSSGLSLFGGNQQNQQNNAGSSLFGGLNQNQNQGNANTNSLFGNSLGQSQQPQQNQLHATLTGSPYGNEQLFSSLAAPSPPVGPLATPLSGARPAPRKTPSLLSSARLNTPVYSPRAGSLSRNGGYGFSYSTYGTPGSAFTSGSLTPGASSLLKPTGSFGSALTSRLNKSYSTSNLRGDSISSEGRSLLRPNAFSPEGTPGRYDNGNVRKLKIDRSLRTDLFGPAPRPIEAAKESDAPGLRKRVSFENRAEDSATPEATSSNALVRTEDDEESGSPGSMRAAPTKSQASSKPPEMEQVNGASALTTVPEDAEAPRAASAPAAPASKAPSLRNKSEVGDYWTKPSLKDLKNMSRAQLEKVGNFTVGREGVGRIEFGQVDLTNTPLEDICGGIVQLNPRSATVYQDDHNKPAQGKALNVPSTIFLDNSWPRSQGGKKAVTVKSGRDYDKHIARLKRVGGTQFLNYNPDTGVWSFKVEHFTTYGLDDDEDDESEYLGDSRMDDVSSPLSDAPDTPPGAEDVTLQSMETGTGEPDDTFRFKLDRRSQASIPGGFDSDIVYGDLLPDDDFDEQHLMSGGLGDVDMDDPFISGGAVQAPSPGAVERYHSSMIEDEHEIEEQEQDIPGSFVEEPKLPRPILKPSSGLNAFVSPEKLATESWEEQLQRTMSPKKRDRQALREMQQSLLRVREDDMADSPLKRSMLGHSALNQSYLAQKSATKTNTTNLDKGGKGDLGQSQAFRTAMDLMDSLYEQDKSSRKATAGAKGFEYPNSKKPRLPTSGDDEDPSDAAWHDSVRPNFGNNGILSYSVPGSAPQVSGDLSRAMAPLLDEHKDIRFAKFAPADDIRPRSLLKIRKEETEIDISDGFPAARTLSDVMFSGLADIVDETSIADQERAIWRLCSALFDPLDLAWKQYTQGVPEDHIEQLTPRIRMDALGSCWSQLVAPSVQDGLKRARSAEEKAVLYLTQNDIVAACDALVAGRFFKLATLVSQLPGTGHNREMMLKQIEAWRERNDWSEMSDAVRALYSILAGEVCVVKGVESTNQTKVHQENRVHGFNIAEKFGLSWRQSFALRLYFGGHQTIQEASQAYINDLQSGREHVQPTSTWKTGTATPDILMELLRLAAGQPDLPQLFNPLVVSGSGLHNRLTWQLALHLTAQGHCTLSDFELDQLTYAFATELEDAGHLVGSTWVLLHINDPAARQKAVVAQLNRHGDRISTTPSEEGRMSYFEQLTNDNQIPSKYVWRAKALWASGGLGDAGVQTEWLLRAGDIDTAHSVLCTTVAPQAIISQDYEGLSKLLQEFNGRKVDGWEQGGQVFIDFLKLVRTAPSSKRYSADQEAAVQRLRRGLAGMEEDGLAKKTLEERVAVIEMGKVLEEFEDGNKDREMEDVNGGHGSELDLLHRYQLAMATAA